ncbi:hypothetical protein NDU88_005336 [Pleurodeles waltl]|uniref:Uncharacterized protein n=1 Tax=Pleurodeles waltl TaxID=8319 RepID=A0AAV7SLL4_PLEWA|nr:hypothetical protein NDU88_005336 [Pleurodeles waltl]
MAVGIRQTLTLELRQLEQDVRTAERKQAEGIIAETELTRLRTEWSQADAPKTIRLTPLSGSYTLRRR